MIEIIAGFLLFVTLIGGLGLPLVSGLALDPDERLTLGAAAGCVAIYLFAWVVYWSALPSIAFAFLPVAAGAGIALRRRALLGLWRTPSVRRLAGLWAILAGWCLGLLALVRSYSGGEWVGDWIEHYERARFFLEHQPLDTLFLRVYPLPARPPLANLVTGAFLALTGTGFAQFQVFTTLLATLAFFPAALLARHFRGTKDGDPAALLALLLMLSPLFVENATFAWTKLPAAFFVLAGLYLFLRAGTPARDGRTIACVLCLAAALLTHYSAAPYIIVLAIAWFFQRRAQWSQADFWRGWLRPALPAVALLATWFVWSGRHYGSATFLSNTAVTENAGLSPWQQLARRGVNLFNTVVPHPLRPADYAFVQQASSSSWWRDYFFNLYQTNLLPAFGSGGAVALAVLVWRHRREHAAFWLWFVMALLLLNIAVVSWPDRWGATHIGLQALVILGLARVAAGWSELGPWVRRWLVVGLGLDFALGIALQFWVEHLDFPADLFATHRDSSLLYLHGYSTWNNFLSKSVLQLSFLGDRGIPAPAVCAFLGLLLLLAGRLVLRHDRGSSV